MTFTLELPAGIARCFGNNAESRTRAVIEALAIEGVRSGQMTTEQVRRLLGFATRYEADGFLKEHEVYYRLTLDDVARDAALEWRFSVHEADGTNDVCSGPCPGVVFRMARSVLIPLP